MGLLFFVKNSALAVISPKGGMRSLIRDQSSPPVAKPGIPRK